MASSEMVPVSVCHSGTIPLQGSSCKLACTGISPALASHPLHARLTATTALRQWRACLQAPLSPRPSVCTEAGAQTHELPPRTGTSSHVKEGGRRRANVTNACELQQHDLGFVYEYYRVYLLRSALTDRQCRGLVAREHLKALEFDAEGMQINGKYMNVQSNQNVLTQFSWVGACTLYPFPSNELPQQ